MHTLVQHAAEPLRTRDGKITWRANKGTLLDALEVEGARAFVARVEEVAPWAQPPSHLSTLMVEWDIAQKLDNIPPPVHADRRSSGHYGQTKCEPLERVWISFNSLDRVRVLAWKGGAFLKEKASDVGRPHPFLQLNELLNCAVLCNQRQTRKLARKQCPNR